MGILVYLLHLRVRSIRRVDTSHEDHRRYARIADKLEESVGKLLLERLPEMMIGKKWTSTWRRPTLSTGERCWMTAILLFALPNTARVRFV